MLDLDRITNPLRLAAGSHQEGSGKGCAMNVISYINGDKKITDYPECSARPLARMVQQINDRLAGSDGYLSPEDSVTVLDLGWLTVGTGGASYEVRMQWLADLLVFPEWGVVKFSSPQGSQAINDVAALLTRSAGGGKVSTEEWLTARKSAQAAYAAADADADADAAAAAAFAYAAADAYAYAYAAYAAYAADAAYGYGSGVGARISFARWAIMRYRELMGLDQVSDIGPDEVDSALDKMVRV